jgi:hypothetical protein
VAFAGRRDRDRPRRVGPVDIHYPARGSHLDDGSVPILLDAGVEQDLVQIRPVVVPVGGIALVLAALPQRRRDDDSAVPPAVPNLVQRFGVNGIQPFTQSQPDEDTTRVGSGPDPGSDLPQLGGLIQHSDADSFAPRRKCGGQSAEPATHDRDPVRLARHHCSSNLAGARSPVERSRVLATGIRFSRRN